MKVIVPFLVLGFSWSAFCVYVGYVFGYRKATTNHMIEGKDAEISGLQSRLLESEWQRIQDKKGG